MSYTLVIVESPSKCKKIEHFLNNYKEGINYKCLASFGHIRELAGIQSINIHNKFEPTFVMCESKKDQIAKLRKAINEANQVILATDDDREGEAIAWHLCEVFHLPLKTTQRILFHEITEPAIRKAIDAPFRVNISVVHAQLARQVLDILVGYKVSPLLWQHVKDGLSAGRCQTPALRLIYDNQKEIEAAPVQQLYTITGYFTSKTIPFILNYEETDETALQAFLNASIGFSHCYKEYKLQNKKRSAPEPFSTSSLQQTCSNELHYSPKETMSICQKLYEGGYITYPRTDSKNYSKEFLKIAREFIRTTYGAEYECMLQHTTTAPTTTAPITTAKENGEAAHEAIRVTHLDCMSLDEEEANTETATVKKMDKVYQLIRRRTLESCMAEAIVSVLSATITAPMEREYHYTTEHIVFAGWKKVKMDKTQSDEESKYYTFLQTLKQASVVACHKIKASVSVKGIKSHVTEARLVQLLEEKGIGRPSTFSSLVEKIQERKYVVKENVKGKMIKCVDYELTGKEVVKITMEKEFGNEKNKLIIQPVGIIALEFLMDYFEDIFHYDYTKQMEDDLDSVAQDDKKWYDVCKSCYDELERLMAAITKRGKETIRIDDSHTYMIGKHGPVIKVTGAKSDEVHFKSVRKDIDLNKLRRGEYMLEDVLEKNDTAANSIGLFKNNHAYVKTGKFGTYLEWNGVTKSLKHLKKTIDEITLDDVLDLLYDADTEIASGTDGKTIRTITDDACIRKGKYGNYIFYKTSKMKKPRFLKLDGFTGGDYLTCDVTVLQAWFKDTYKI